MICDDFERSIAESMDDLDELEYLAPEDVKPHRFHKTLLPEIQENSPLESNGSSSSVSFRPPELIHRKTWSSLTMPFQERRRLSQCKEEDVDEEAKPMEQNPNPNTQIAGARRKFIVTKMNETNVVPRPEAENLRHLTNKVNAATIHFPCSSNSQRAPLAGLFSTRGAFNPHLDKRFFDSSLVEVRMNETSSQSLNNPPPVVEQNVWEKRHPSPDRDSVVSVIHRDFCFPISTKPLFSFRRPCGVGYAITWNVEMICILTQMNAATGDALLLLPTSCQIIIQRALLFIYSASKASNLNDKYLKSNGKIAAVNQFM